VPSHLCLSIRFLAPAFHGRCDGALSEWPPSPLRVFQSLVAAAARRRHANYLAALEWLESQPPPVLIAPASTTASGYRLSVPNNAMDIVAKAWSRGNDSNSGDANPATHRTMKSVHPTLMPEADTVHYLWSLADPPTGADRIHIELLFEAARSIVALGWGVDMAVGHAAILSDQQTKALTGERWLPGESASEDGLRVPVEGTLSDVLHRHERFLNRVHTDHLGRECFTAPPPLSVYKKVPYRRATDPATRPYTAFSLLKLDTSGFKSFETARRALTVAGMLKCAAKAAARGEWPSDSLILGHGEPKGANHVAVSAKRFAYLPLPSIETRGHDSARVAGSVRRCIVTAFAEGCDDEIAWARRNLSGRELISEQDGEPTAVLSLIPKSDYVVRCYTQPATSWATVTPVVLPGYDDPAHYRRRLSGGTSAEGQKKLLEQLNDRIERLLRKAIIQAGFSETLAKHAELDWSKRGFWPGCELADRYGTPDHLQRFPRLHVKIQWRDQQNREVLMAGPICIGGGRFYGLGLFASY
jgi:CRISPR-associated protein Csb2